MKHQQGRKSHKSGKSRL